MKPNSFSNEREMSGFREQFKFYKRKGIPLDMSGVMDVSSSKDHNFQTDVARINLTNIAHTPNELFGMKQPSQWMVYEILSKPGLFIIKNPFLFDGQRYWIIKCLEYYTKKPNKLNIDVHGILEPGEGDWWEFCQRNRNTKNGNIVLEKLCWATFGYHHNWDTKVYSEASKSDFPKDLKVLCSYIGDILNFSNFSAQAAILNFYHSGSSLSGHTDHSEANLKAPLFSLSFGQSAIFLIGGKRFEENALPILVESGDIMIMSGESRLYYHGVPRILVTKTENWNGSNITEQTSNGNSLEECFTKEVIEKLYDNNQWEPFNNYVNKCRINLNVRQVLFPGQEILSY